MPSPAAEPEVSADPFFGETPATPPESESADGFSVTG
jgi:hypothetical protein